MSTYIIRSCKFASVIIILFFLVGCSDSSDESMKWLKLPFPSAEDVTGICFTDSDLGYAVTATGKTFKTTDGGETFEVLEFSAGVQLEDAYFLSDDDGFVFGDKGYLAMTTDGGATWNSSSVDESYHLYDMIFLDDDHGFLAGMITSGPLQMRGVIGFSADEGENWSFDTTEFNGFRHLDMIKKLNVWVAGDGMTYNTTDRGETWEVNRTGNKKDIVRGVFFALMQYGWCVGDDGLLLGTTDGGWSWNRPEKITAKNLNCLTAPEVNDVYIAGDGIIAFSKNRGGAWEIDSTSYSNTFYDIHWQDDVIYLCGSDGILLKAKL